MNLKWSQVVPSFVAGLVVATLLCLYCPRGGWHPGEGRPSENRMVKKFARHLDLTPDQTEKLTAILRSKRQKMDDVRCSLRPRFDEIRVATDAEILAILTPEQRAKFDEMKARRAKRHEKREKKWSLICDGASKGDPAPTPAQ